MLIFQKSHIFKLKKWCKKIEFPHTNVAVKANFRIPIVAGWATIGMRKLIKKANFRIPIVAVKANFRIPIVAVNAYKIS